MDVKRSNSLYSSLSGRGRRKENVCVAFFFLFFLFLRQKLDLLNTIRKSHTMLQALVNNLMIVGRSIYKSFKKIKHLSKIDIDTSHMTKLHPTKRKMNKGLK